MTPEELEALKASDPERYEALTRQQRDERIDAAARWRAAGYSVGASECDPCVPTPYERQGQGRTRFVAGDR
ncbi:hypothetical protein DLJ47_03945 [Micromonospora sp. S4605]|nr:hypothetical protein DLJ47_03945 [Micromonospora sp. S4605]